MKTVFGFEETFPEPGIGLGMLIGWNLACLRSCRTNGGGLVKSGKWGLGGEEATCGGIRGSKSLRTWVLLRLITVSY
ncbi:hypothetical protein [Neisseria dumasiana]|uniref:hypothetical protein n=1 Tax=Neisseria dumasiana TaxID=1931275 RepID=UPI000A19AC41|nr:hypothetical protein [Neisseria dumasiana]OSI17218.1 hypothetical protein BV914_01870 [Neisseria dumasiana]